MGIPEVTVMKTWKSYVLTIFALSLLGICTAHAGDIGELDTTFGDEGKVVTSFGQYGDQAYAVALQSDGKILAAGSASNGVDLDIAIARYNQDGSLDTSFGREGKIRNSLGNGDEEITAIAVQDNGYIVVAGYTVVDGGKDFVLIRFTPDGILDNSFGEGGIIVTAFGNQDDEITGMTIDDQGRIVVCGYVTGTAGTIIAIARYLESGNPDTTFGDGGSGLLDIGGSAMARSIDIDAEGRIVLAGSYSQAKRMELMVLRFLDSGEFDTGFGQQGIGVPADRETSSEGYGVRLMEDGRIMVAGTVGKKGDLDAALYRFTESGQPDTSFGYNGVLVTSASDEDDMALAIDVLDNVIGLSGYSTFNTKRDFLFVSVEQTKDDGANVALNENKSGFRFTERKYANVFDVSGKLVQPADDSAGTPVKSLFNTTQFGYTDDLSYAVVLQADGKAVSVGFTQQDGVSNFAVARYLGPVANAVGSGSDAAVVSWIMTKEATNVNRTGAFTGGTILTSGVTVSQRGVVYSIAPDPVYKAGQDPTPTPTPTPTPDPGTASPVITITAPASAGVAVSQDDRYDITYNLTDSDSASLSVTFYYSINQTFDGDTVDPVACPETTVSPGTGRTCSWDTKYVVANGQAYYIYGVASDGINTGNNWSPGTVTVNDPTGATARSRVATSVKTPYVFNLTPYFYDSDVYDSDPPEASSVDISTLSVVPSQLSESADTGLVVYNGSPSGEIAAGSSMTYIGVYTSDKSACRYSPLAGLDYASMTETMATADNLSHIGKVDGLQDAHDYSYHVQCMDLAGNRDASGYKISFKVAAAENTGMQQYRQLTNAFGSFFVADVHAATGDAAAGDAAAGAASTKSRNLFDFSAPDYSTEGSTDDGGGVGSYSSILSNLKPGTLYYVRAYALDSNNNVYYGNQITIKTADSCFIATAAYGTIIHPYVKVLRNFRDQYMITNVIGRNLVNLYYHYSPPAADYIAARPFVRGVVRVALLPVIGFGWLALNVGFAGMLLLTVLTIVPSVFVYRSYKKA